MGFVVAFLAAMFSVAAVAIQFFLVPPTRKGGSLAVAISFALENKKGLHTMLTTTKPSIIVQYPAIPATSTIRNDPASILQYLETVAPRVASIVKDMQAHKPELSDRIARAGLIVVQQKITLRPENANNTATWNIYHRSATGVILAKVQGTADEPYLITNSTRDFCRVTACNCPDHAPKTRKLEKACKHNIAYVIAIYLKEKESEQ